MHLEKLIKLMDKILRFRKAREISYPHRINKDGFDSTLEEKEAAQGILTWG